MQEGQDCLDEESDLLQNHQTQFLGHSEAAPCPAPASSQPNPLYFYEHPPPAPGPDSAIARALLWLSVTAEQLSLAGDVAFCFGTVQGSRDLRGVIPWGCQHLLPRGASHTGKPAAIRCGGGNRGKKVIYLRWGCLFCCPPVPLSLPLLC